MGISRSYAAKSIDTTYSRETQFREKLAYKAENTDTQIRTTIQSVIANGINEGISKEEIVERLNSNAELEKYKNFFEKWTEHQMGKSGLL